MRIRSLPTGQQARCRVSPSGHELCRLSDDIKVELKFGERLSSSAGLGIGLFLCTQDIPMCPSPNIQSCSWVTSISSPLPRPKKARACGIYSSVLAKHLRKSEKYVRKIPRYLRKIPRYPRKIPNIHERSLDIHERSQDIYQKCTSKPEVAARIRTRDFINTNAVVNHFATKTI